MNCSDLNKNGPACACGALTPNRRRITMTLKRSLLVLAIATIVGGCHNSATPPSHRPTTTFTSRPIATPLVRSGDEIVVCGQYFHTNTPVVLWTDPGGYDAYRVERRFAPFDKS